MSFLLTIIELVIILSVVAIVHEFGHFLIAKAFKMTVNEFSIGFGKAIWQKKYKGTTYSFRVVLLGGYVAIEGEDGETTDVNSFDKKPCYQRILVLVAGVVFNFILAIGILMGVNFSSDTFTTTLKKIDEGGPLYEAGIREGDSIINIGGKTTHIYEDIAIYSNIDQNDVEIEYMSNGTAKSVIAKNVVKTKGYIGVYFQSKEISENGQLIAIIDMVSPGGRAEQAGIKSGDKIIKVQDVAVNTTNEVVGEISKYSETEIEITVLRDGEEKSIKVIPEEQLYIDLGILDVEIKATSFIDSWHKSISTISRVINSYVDLFKGKVGLNQMSGIVGVGEIVSKTDGFIDLVSLLATLSLAIGVANIMPFPPLDGGKIVLVATEWISRKKVSRKVELVLSTIGFALLILLTIYVTIKDIIRII